MVGSGVPEDTTALVVDKALVAQLRQIFRIEEADLAAIREVREVLGVSLSKCSRESFEWILSIPGTAAAVKDEKARQRALMAKEIHLRELVSGRLDEAYVRKCLQVGEAHETLEVYPLWFLAHYAGYMVAITRELAQVGSTPPPDRLLAMRFALVKLLLLDIGLVWEAYYRRRARRIGEAYKALEIDHNPALHIIEQRDKEIAELRTKL
ncbi:MAG: protoglobin domain-containing protein [Chloroflexota bacterium]|nr:protoglobin domain-containing protein [Chloroflexota bacterium]